MIIFAQKAWSPLGIEATKKEINMSDEIDVDWVDDDGTRQPKDEEEMMWTHETLNQFELLIDTLGISTAMFLMSEEHERIITAWVKDREDIQHRRKQ